MENEIVKAVEIIKTAILNSQYEAAKDVNRVQLALYFGIGRFLASKKGKKTWGTGVLETISENLRKQLPGLRGFSATSLKKMRQFYENWSFLDVPNSTVTTDELSEPSESLDKSIIAITEFKVSVNFTEFPIDDFLKVPFSHHVQIFSRVKNLDERYFYITKTSQEHLAVEELNKSIERNDFLHQKELPNNFVNTLSSAKQARKAVQIFKDEYLLDFINVEEIGERDMQDVDERVVEYVIQDYDKPMGVSTYKSMEDMPEKIKKVMPDIEELRKLIQS